ncbi:MAG: molybdopterin-dependent oxidoreductase [Ilumatobacter sp.]
MGYGGEMAIPLAPAVSAGASAELTDDVATHFRTCPLCEACCGLEITTKGDQVLRIRGDMNDPNSKGFICPKGSSLKQLHEDPDRLTSPRIRTATGWKDVTWDEAFAEIERRLAPIIEAHGNQALSLVYGNPGVHNLGGMLYRGAVVAAAKTTNLFSSGTVDQMPKHVSSGLLFGQQSLFPVPDLDRCDYLLMLGANPYTSNGSLVSAPDMPGRLEALRDRGTVIVVDPRRTKTAENASEHLTIVPGTDVFWLMALIHTMFDEGLVDIGRLEPYVSGVDAVRDLVAGYSPEVVADRCGIDAATTRRITRDLAAAPAAAVYGRMGVHTVEFGALSSWATDVLNVLTGNLDRPGGVMFNCAPTANLSPMEPGGPGWELGRWHGRASGRPEVKGELPCSTMAEEITTPGDDAIRAMFVLACNPVRSFPNSDRIDEALQQLDLLVVVDPYVTATARHAHVVLPPSSALERSHYDLGLERFMLRTFAKYSKPVFEADAVDEAEIMSRLALVIGGKGYDADPAQVHDALIDQLVTAEIDNPRSPIHGREKADIFEMLSAWTGPEQVIDLRLRVGHVGDGFGVNPDGLTLQKLIDEHPHGADFGPLVERLPDEIKTRSGTIELAAQPIVADMNRLAAVFGSAGSADPADGEMLLIGRRHLKTVNSWTHNVNVLIKGKTDCTLQVHPDDATHLNLVDGCTAEVSSRVGLISAPVEVTDEVMPGVVCLPHGWGFDEPGIEMRTAKTKPGVNSNVLTDDATLDDLSGTGRLNGIPVRVRALR